MKSSDWAEISVFLGALYLGLLNLKCWLSLRVVLQERRSSDVAATASHSSDRVSLFEADASSADRCPSVTVAVPILSGDPLLSEKLSSTARALTTIDATICVLWLVDESDLAGQQIVSELKQSFPIGRMIVCSDAPADVNPKSFKLQIALDDTASDLFAVIDDDTTIDATAFLQAIRAMRCTDLYTGLPCYQSDGRFWSRLLATFVNNNAAITYLPLLNFFPPISINGMFYIVRTEHWRDIGGYTAILHELCDDYAVRRHAAGFHWRVTQGLTAQRLQTSVNGPGHYISLMHRWMLFATLLIQDQRLPVKLLIIFLLGIPPFIFCGVVITTAVSLLVDGEGVGNSRSGLVAAFCLLLTARHLLIVAVHRTVFPFRSAIHPGISILSELLQPLHAVHAICRRTIRWRSRVIQVVRGNRFRILSSSTSLETAESGTHE